MEKRAFLALFLSMGVIIGWSLLFPPQEPPRRPTEPPPATAPSVATDATSAAALPAPAAPTIEAATASSTAPTPAIEPEQVATTEERFVLENARARVTISNRGAAIESFELPGYTSDSGQAMDMIDPKAEGPRPLALSLAKKEQADWLASAKHQVEREPDGGLTFTAADGRGLRATRTYRLGDNGDLLFSGNVAGGGKPTYGIGPGARPLTPDEAGSRYVVVGAVWDEAGQCERKAAVKAREPIVVPPGARFAGLDDNYFLAAVLPEGDSTLRFVPAQVEVKGKDAKPIQQFRLEVAPASTSYSGRLVFTAKDLDRLPAFGVGLEHAAYFGPWIFGSLAKVFWIGLRWIHAQTANWGIAIILLTIAIRVVLFPFTLKSTLAMKKMQALAPKMEAIKEKYRKKKSDPDARAKMNQETMALYQAEGINPMAGCLPIVFQIPIFIGLYNLFAHAIELRHAPFALWIVDLSAKDPYHVLPILMGATWLAQTAMTPTTADPLQKKIFYLMPIIFTVVMMAAPSGLTLYFSVSNTLSILQMLIINRMGKPSEAR